MKNRLTLVIFSAVSLILASISLSWFKAEYSTPIPEASHPSGYYEDSFYLTLTAPDNGTIYYTTDGSTPTTASTPYSGGIFLEDRSGERNVGRAVQNITTDWKHYQPESEPVPKGTVIRAVYVNDLGICSEILSNTYFVGIQPPKAGYTLSLICEYEDLFGENGIYVTGAEYDAWYLSKNPQEPHPIPNFSKDLEASALVQVIRSDGSADTQPIGLQLQGASYRGAILKRFKLISRAEYSGNNTFKIPLFTGASTHSVMLKQSMTDAIVSSLFSDRAVATQKSVPVSVYLNGEFWYDTYMLECFDSQYFRQYFQIDPVDMVKHGAVDEETSALAEGPEYMEFMQWVSTTDFSDDSEFEQLEKEVDLQSYIDFIAINYLLSNVDFSDDKNSIMWRSANISSAGYEDGRWRWCIYDVDSIVDSQDIRDCPAAEVNVFTHPMPYCTVPLQDTALFHALLENPQLRQRFVTSFMDILNNNLAYGKVEAVLQDHGYTMDWNESYFRNRPTYAVQHLAEVFALTGTLEPVTVTSCQPEMGDVYVNTSCIDLEDRTWDGQYFTDYPITIRAVPREGYVFLGWKGAANTTDPAITLTMDGAIALEAVFAQQYNE